MSRKKRLTAATAASLTAAYVLYSVVVSPLVKPAGVISGGGEWGPDGGDEALPSTTSAEHAKRHLSAQPWAAKAPYQFSNQQKTFFYFKEWNQIDSDGSVRFEPFAFIWFKRMTGSDDGKEVADDENVEPVTMVADSAVVKFASPFSITNPNPGRVVGGKLEGPVHISGPNGLAIDGHDFIFSEKALKIWSDHDVKFAYGPGPHRGFGHGLQMELIPARTNAASDELAVNGVRSIRLRRDVNMDLLMEEDGKPPTKVKIRSSGAFNFDLESNIATFEKDVRVRRPVTRSEIDSLDCMTLRLVFEETKPATGMPAKKVAKPDPTEFKTVNPNLEFRRLLAEGAEGGKRDVVLNSRTNELTARMSELRYDSQTRVVVLLDDDSVSTLRGDSEVHCPEITLVHKQDNEIESVWCRGAGWLKRRDRLTGSTAMAARWHKQLRLYPDPKSDLDIIEFQERAWVSQSADRSEIKAETIRLWLERGEALETSQTAAANSSAFANESLGQQKPKRLVAVENVVMTSPRLHAKTDRLEAWFETAVTRTTANQTNETQRSVQLVSYRVPPKKQTPLQVARKRRHFRQSRTKPRLIESGKPGRNVHASLQDRIPEQTRPQTPLQEKRSKRRSSARSLFREQPSEDSGPMDITANLIRVLIGKNPTTAEQDVREVWTEGDVHIKQERLDGTPPLDVTGTRLHLKNNSDNDQQVHVFGKPAQIRDREISLDGNEIFMDRGRNFSWVNGVGALGLPVEKDLEGKSLPQPKQLVVRWTDKMTFDGLHADFFGDVKASLEKSRVACREMRIKLTQQVVFADENQDQSKVDVHTIYCKEDVLFDSIEYTAGKLTTVRKAGFKAFSLDQQTGDTVGIGPGWVLSWSTQKGNENPSVVAPTAVAQANQPLRAESTEWEYARIDFAGKAVGNLNDKHTTFHDQVRIVHGPVKRLRDVIDPDELTPDSAEMSCEKLIASEMLETRDKPSHMVLQASGNAKLEGRKFFARSEYITYNDSNKLFVLFSKGSQKATIWRQEKPGAEYMHNDAQRMEFIPSRNVLRLHQTTGGQGIQ